jgi:predicted MPP superfamily phosphohydrolase
VTGAAAAAALAAWSAWFEPRRLVVRRLPLALPAWPRELDGLRVGIVSDLHTGVPHAGLDATSRAVTAVGAEAPDLICLLGDFIDRSSRITRRVDTDALAARLAPLRAPRGVFAVLGNHDWLHGGERIAAALRAAGIRVLENEAAPTGAVWIAGVADLRMRSPDVAAALVAVPPGAPVVLLSHDPDLFPRVPDRVALTVSGHTHGGQVAVPLLRRRAIPSRFGERYARGHVEEGGRHLYVTAGFGTSGWPVRLLAPPEVVVLRLSPASEPRRGRAAQPRRGRGPTRAGGRPPWSGPGRRSG